MSVEIRVHHKVWGTVLVYCSFTDITTGWVWTGTYHTAHEFFDVFDFQLRVQLYRREFPEYEIVGVPALEVAHIKAGKESAKLNIASGYDQKNAHLVDGVTVSVTWLCTVSADACTLPHIIRDIEEAYQVDPVYWTVRRTRASSSGPDKTPRVHAAFVIAEDPAFCVAPDVNSAPVVVDRMCDFNSAANRPGEEEASAPSLPGKEEAEPAIAILSNKEGAVPAGRLDWKIGTTAPFCKVTWMAGNIPGAIDVYQLHSKHHWAHGDLQVAVEAEDDAISIVASWPGGTYQLVTDKNREKKCRNGECALNVVFS